VSDTLSPDAPSAIDTFYDTTLKPKLDAVEHPRRKVRWLIIKSLMVVLPPIAVLIAGDLIDDVQSVVSGRVAMAIACVWLVAGLLFVLLRNFIPGVAAYAAYRHRFKQDVVAEIFKAVCPYATYDPLQGITAHVFDAPGLFNTRGAFQCDDRVRGRIGQTPFEASEVGRAYTTGTGRNSRSYVVFRGLFFHLDFNQRLAGVTLVEPRKALPHQVGEREGLSVVTFDDQAFEKEFKVHASNEAEARALLTPALTARLLALRQKADKPVFLAFKDRRAYVGVHFGKTLFEPGIARSLSKADVHEIAAQFTFVETIARELNLHARSPSTAPDESLLQGPDAEPNPVARLAADKGSALTTDDLWQLASVSIDDSAKDGEARVERPGNTRIQLEPAPGGLSITYGLRFGFWVILALSLCGLLLAASAARAPNAPAWAGPASAWVRTLPPVPWLDRFAADAPTPWLIVGSVVAVLFALFWTGYVRRIAVELDRILIYRGFRPFPRVYRRPEYGRVIRINTILYIAKADGLHVMNPTASPVLTEAEARWLTSELKRVLRQQA
jgi:hypothetical protein